MKLIPILFLLTVFSTVQANDNTVYLGIQYSDIEGKDTDNNIENNAAIARLGFITPNNWGLEARTGVGVDDDDLGPVKIELDRIYGLYGLYHFPVGEKLTVYPLIGWSQVKYKASFQGRSAFKDKDGLSYGVGVEAYGVNLEWVRYIDTSELEVTAIAVGYNYHFD
ncbi:MAG: porin family protein [Gammaproteobacteria bacterium]|nr:porin family protein [Gammaproteobacteria bacterium]